MGKPHCPYTDWGKKSLEGKWGRWNILEVKKVAKGSKNGEKHGRSWRQRFERRLRF